MDAASRHLTRLGAQGRPTGSAEAAAARAYCGDVLRGAGWSVKESSFEYSKVAGAFATPAAGVVAALCAVGFYLGRETRAVAVGAAALLAATLGVLSWVGRAGVLDFPGFRRTGVNVEAVRGSAEPVVWLVAHVDSKWQPVSMVVRVLGVAGTSVALAGLAALAALGALRVMQPASGAQAGVWLLGVALLGSVPLMLSVVGAGNAGALDNASGVAAVLHAAEQIPAQARVGIVITDAEEMGLAGSRAWVRGRTPAAALNCDSIDDVGDFTIMYTKAAPARLVERFRDAAAAQGDRLRVIRLIPGVLTDHVPLTDAGWEAATLSKGDLRTLARVHTHGDSASATRGTGIARAAGMLTRIATELG